MKLLITFSFAGVIIVKAARAAALLNSCFKRLSSISVISLPATVAIEALSS